MSKRLDRKALDKRLNAVEAWQAKRDAIEQRYQDRIAATLEDIKRSTAEAKKTLVAAGADSAAGSAGNPTTEYEMPKVIERPTFTVFELFPKSAVSLVCDLEASCAALRLALESASHNDAQYLIGRVRSLSGALYDLCGQADNERSLRSLRTPLTYSHNYGAVSQIGQSDPTDPAASPHTSQLPVAGPTSAPEAAPEQQQAQPGQDAS